MRIIHFKILSGLIFSTVLFLSNTGNAVMSSSSGGCTWIITTTTWSDGKETIDTQLICSAGGGGSTLDPYATNFGGSWSMPTYSVTRELIYSGGGGVQVASSSDDDVKDIINSISGGNKEYECKLHTLTPEEVAADQAGHDFPVLRAFTRGIELPSNFVEATSEDQQAYIAAVGKLPARARSSTIAAMTNPEKDAKMPGECGE